MPDIGERVALNRGLKDTEGGDVGANEVGMVYAHMGKLELVEMDHGETYLGDKRLVVCGGSDVRVVRVAHPGAARRSRPRRKG